MSRKPKPKITGYIVEKTYQVVITPDDLEDGEELNEDLAEEIAKTIDTYEWQQIDFGCVGVTRGD